MRDIKDTMRRFGADALVAGSFAMMPANVAALEVKPSPAAAVAPVNQQVDDLPEETRDHVPRLVAAARIANSPGKYGFTEEQS